MNFIVRHEHQNLIDTISNARYATIDISNEVFVPAQIALFEHEINKLFSLAHIHAHTHIFFFIIFFFKFCNDPETKK